MVARRLNERLKAAEQHVDEGSEMEDSAFKDIESLFDDEDGGVPLHVLMVKTMAIISYAMPVCMEKTVV